MEKQSKPNQNRVFSHFLSIYQPGLLLFPTLFVEETILAMHKVDAGQNQSSALYFDEDVLHFQRRTPLGATQSQFYHC